jgi:catechol 2,3-dioxygenase-like lactoylglutathione lyase family enzyme
LGTNDHARAVAFYDAVLATIGCRRLVEHAGATGYGRTFPDFWIQRPADGAAAGMANGTHVAFSAPDRTSVDAFHRAALAAGGRCDGPPGLRPEYHPRYYACFVRDPDGHKLEAVCIG